MANRTSSSPRRTHRFRPRLIRGTAAIIGVSAALILAACSGGSSGASGTGSTASKGGVVTFAETPEGQPTWILPFYSGEFFTIQEQGWFESMMWPPLFNQANGQSPVVSYAHSLGNQPVYSDNGTVVTLTLKHWKWSDGKPITTRDIMFWLNLLKANKSQWADYTPGQFPDNVTSIKVVSPYEMVMHLDKSYGPAFFTGNELSQITPIPQHVWDKTSAAGAVGNYDETPAGARAVMSFLQSQAKNLKTYATNPLWQTVYGPWKLAGYTLTGKVTFVPNKNYNGPSKPKISQFVEVPFTSFDAEYDALRAGDLTVGDIPANDIDTISEITALGYNVAPWKVFGFNSLFINFNNPTLGPAFRQLYIRQALQYLINQPLQISKVFSGYAQPDYGMVVNGPTSLEGAEPNAYAVQPGQGEGAADRARLGRAPRRRDHLRPPGNGRDRMRRRNQGRVPADHQPADLQRGRSAAGRDDLLQDGRGHGRDQHQAGQQRQRVRRFARVHREPGGLQLAALRLGRRRLHAAQRLPRRGRLHRLRRQQQPRELLRPGAGQAGCHRCGGWCDHGRLQRLGEVHIAAAADAVAAELRLRGAGGEEEPGRPHSRQYDAVGVPGELVLHEVTAKGDWGLRR